MILTLPKTLEVEIHSFCLLNKIDDINNFLICCLRDGFNIIKYGTSPSDNFNKENKPLKIEKYYDINEKSNSERVEKEESSNEIIAREAARKDKEKDLSTKENEAKELKPKKKIRIIKG